MEEDANDYYDDDDTRAAQYDLYNNDTAEASSSRSSSSSTTLSTIGIIGFVSVIVAALVAIIVWGVYRVQSQNRQQAAKRAAQASADIARFRDDEKLVIKQLNMPTINVHGDIVPNEVTPIIKAPTTYPGGGGGGVGGGDEDEFTRALNGMFGALGDAPIIMPPPPPPLEVLGDAEPNVVGWEKDSEYVRLLRKVCPAGYIIKSLGVGINQRINCYKPCPKGTDAVIIDPNVLDMEIDPITGKERPRPPLWREDAKTGGAPNGVEPISEEEKEEENDNTDIGMPSVYAACRVRCNPRTSVDEKNEKSEKVCTKVRFALGRRRRYWQRTSRRQVSLHSRNMGTPQD